MSATAVVLALLAVLGMLVVLVAFGRHFEGVNEGLSVGMDRAEELLSMVLWCLRCKSSPINDEHDRHPLPL